MNDEPKQPRATEDEFMRLHAERLERERKRENENVVPETEHEPEITRAAERDRNARRATLLFWVSFGFALAAACTAKWVGVEAAGKYAAGILYGFALMIPCLLSFSLVMIFEDFQWSAGAALANFSSQ